MRVRVEVKVKKYEESDWTHQEYLFDIEGTHRIWSTVEERLWAENYLVADMGVFLLKNRFTVEFIIGVSALLATIVSYLLSSVPSFFILFSFFCFLFSFVNLFWKKEIEIDPSSREYFVFPRSNVYDQD